MSTKTSREPSSSIVLSKGIHRNKVVIWFRFYHRPDWITKIKQLEEVFFSKTVGQWYIPYTQKAFFYFKKLQIPYTIPGTHRDSKSIGALAGAQDDHTSISSSKKTFSVQPKTATMGTDIQVTSNVTVTWNYNKFAIDIPYSSLSVKKVKSLEGAWWNEKAKKWICKGTINNLEKIQEKWSPLSDQQFQTWYDKISIVNHPCKLILYFSPKYQGKICVQIIGYGANHEYVKRISNRMYRKEGKFYTIPYQKNTIDELLTSYQNLGYSIENRLPEYSEKQAYRNASDVIEHYIRSTPKNIFPFVKRYTDTMLRQNYGIKTIKAYTGKIITLLTSFQKDKMEEVKASEVNWYINKALQNGVSFSLINQIYSAVKLYYDKVAIDDQFEIEKLKRPKKTRRLPVYLSEGEVLRMIDQIDNVKHMCILYLLYGAGLRRGETLNLELKDIYWDRNQIRINNAKGQKDRIVNLSTEMKSLLEIYFEQYKPVQYLFEGQEPGRRYSGSSIGKVIKKAARRARISKKVTPHALRHSFATHLMDRGVSLPKIQALLGHKKIETTMIYTHVTNKEIGKVMSPLDRVLKNRTRDIEKGAI